MDDPDDEIPTTYDGLLGKSWVSKREQRVLVSLLPDGGSYLEIGAASGVTAASILREKPNSRAVVIDMFYDFGPTHEEETGHKHLNECVTNRWAVGARLNIWMGTVCEFWSNEPCPRFDLILVDGDHTRGGVLKDLEFVERLLKPGGVLALHDYDAEKWPGVVAAVEEFVESRLWSWETTTGMLLLLRRAFVR